MRRRIRASIVVLAAAGGGALLAADKPDFSGDWTLSLTRSTLATRGIEAGTAHIVHREPVFSFARRFVTGKGPDEVSYTLTTDGRAETEAAGNATTTSRLYWEGDELVLDQKIQMGGRTATNVVRYGLADGGKTLVARESFRGPRLQYDNTWVFDRK